MFPHSDQAGLQEVRRSHGTFFRRGRFFDRTQGVNEIQYLGPLILRYLLQFFQDGLFIHHFSFPLQMLVIFIHHGTWKINSTQARITIPDSSTPFSCRSGPVKNCLLWRNAVNFPLLLRY